MADTTVTREDGSTVVLGGAWGDQAALDTTAGLEFNPEAKADVTVEFEDVTQIVTTPKQAVIFPPSTSVVVTPATATKAANATQQLTVVDSSGNDVHLLATYTTSDATKGTVNATGLVTAVATGTATITAHYKGHTDTLVLTIS